MTSKTLEDIARVTPRGCLAEAEDLAWKLLEHLLLNPEDGE